MNGFDILEKEQRYRQILRSCEVSINAIMSKVEAFKIGKTGDTCDERLANYNGEYESIISLHESNDEDEASRLEADLINKYILNNKCMNEKEGDGSLNDPMTDKNGRYIVYMVYSEKHEDS